MKSGSSLSISSGGQVASAFDISYGKKIKLTGKSVNDDDQKHVLPYQGIGLLGSLLLWSVFWLPPAPLLLLCL